MIDRDGGERDGTMKMTDDRTNGRAVIEEGGERGIWRELGGDGVDS